MFKLDDFRDYVRKLLELLDQLLAFIKAHPLFVSLVAVLAVAYCGAYYLVTLRPAEVIHRYFANINERDYDRAYFCFQTNKKDLERPGADRVALLKAWSANFKTHQISRLTNITPRDAGLVRWLLQVFSNTRGYDVVYEYDDEFKKNDLILPQRVESQQETGAMWAYIRSVRTANGVLSAPDADASMILHRRTSGFFTVSWDGTEWLIAAASIKEIALVY